MCLYGIMSYFSNEDIDPLKAQLYAAGLITASVLSVVTGHPFILGLLHLGMKMRVALCSLVYRKALRLSHTSLGDTSIGQVVNLLSNDVSRFDGILINVHFLWLAPLELFVVTFLMYQKVGESLSVLNFYYNTCNYRSASRPSLVLL